jgi:Domain of unknown function (DUF3303)
MLYMVIERFRDLSAVSDRFHKRGRMMPEGVNYCASWMDQDGQRCFQIMESTDRGLLDEWMRNWADLLEFEVTEVLTSNEFWERYRS